MAKLRAYEKEYRRKRIFERAGEAAEPSKAKGKTKPKLVQVSCVRVKDFDAGILPNPLSRLPKSQ